MTRFRRRSSDVSARRERPPHTRARRTGPVIGADETAPKIDVRPGLNVWRLLRSDRDGVSREHVMHEAASAVRYFLGLAIGPGRDQSLVASGHDPLEFRFGDVRPLQVMAASRKAGQAMPERDLLADRTLTVPGFIPTVSGKKPWWVLVRFWWRGPAGHIDFPGVRRGLLWWEPSLVATDWLLDRAVHVPAGAPAAPPDPGGETWLPAVAEHATEALEEYAEEASKWAVLLAILAWAALKK